ncbi:hypothetical protein [Rhodohalobacter sulfatireducens]|uniref:Uncharacterized protein n=1 Tax=Rhodohalobacter sulfatireducens TaxID=2911366 RepID=A0ABS9K8C0_9BACT|nr:hypothetical protein [Rhodohalobacter sulfatireducens]MCG2587104.1 hypothetical protein [Rhodohalobacter sulfatireducens]
MNRWLTLLIIILLFAGCSTSSDSEPEEIPNISVNANLPDSMIKDDLESIYVSFAHPDGLSGEVAFDVNVENQFTKQLSGETLWDTTFTPQLLGNASDLDATSSAVLTYDVQSNSEVPKTVSGSRPLQLIESPYFEGPLSVSNVVTGEAVDGHMTIQEGPITLDITNGQAQIPRELDLLKDEFDDGIEAVFEADGYVTHREPLQRAGSDLQSIQLIPRKGDGFDFDLFLTFLREDENGNKIIHQFQKEEVLETHILDQGVYRRPGQFEFSNTTDPNLVPSDEFVAHSVDLMEYLTPLLKDVAGIDVVTYVQSQDEKTTSEFVRNGFTIGSWEDAPYDITQGSAADDGRIVFSYMMQQVFDGSGARVPDYYRGVCFDTMQSFIFSPENPRAMCGENDVTALATPVLTVNYTFGPLDGLYQNLDLTGKDGQSITEVWYVHTENE